MKIIMILEKRGAPNENVFCKGLKGEILVRSHLHSVVEERLYRTFPEESPTEKNDLNEDTDGE